MFGLFRKKPRLLLIDDNKTLARGLKRCFDHNALPTDVEFDKQGLESRYQGAPPRAIVLDIKLGGDNGIDMIPDIKQHWPDTPIVIITGMGYDDELMKKALERGAAGYVSKSVPPDEVLAAITRVLEHPEHHQTS